MKTADMTARILPMRPAPSRDGLYALASAWHASGADVCQFVRPTRAPRPSAARAFERAEPPYFPDGPSAA